MATLSATGTDISPGFAVVRGTEDIRQRCVQRLRLFAGEWFLDSSAGVPWLQQILTRPVTVGLANSIVSNALASVEGVVRVIDVSATLDARTRAMRFTAILETAGGETSVAAEIAP